MIPHEDISSVLIDYSTNLSFVDEIILVYQGSSQERRNDITYLETPDYGINGNHGAGLHLGTAKAKNEYVLWTDIDAFYVGDVTAKYIFLMEKYNLHYIGVQHYHAPNVAMGRFPTVISLLTKKEFLPPGDNWLTTLPPTDKLSLFPNPEMGTDIGSNLYLWCVENNYRWLSFGTEDIRWYDWSNNDSNFGKVDLEAGKFFYHHTSQDPHPKMYSFFKQIYKDSYSSGEEGSLLNC